MINLREESTESPSVEKDHEELSQGELTDYNVPAVSLVSGPRDVGSETDVGGQGQVRGRLLHRTDFHSYFVGLCV